MKVRMVVHYAGTEYYGNWDEAVEAEDVSKLADSVQNAVRHGDSFQLAINDGSYIVFGETALKTCVILVETLNDA